MKGDYLFRNSAFLQWGKSKKSIGSFLLLNPGKAKPLDLRGVNNGNIEEHKVNLDPTMQQIVKLVRKIYPDDINGKIHIYNLFSLVNPNNEDAILLYEELVENNTIDPYEVIPPLEELKSHPWICCGWGINSEKRYRHLQQIKLLWKKSLQEAGVPTFGKLHNNGIDYYHLRPRLIEDQEELLNDLTEIFNSKLGTISRSSYWVSVVYFEEEYIIIFDDEPFSERPTVVTIDCNNLAEIRTVIRVLKAVYSPNGSVHVESLLSDMNRGNLDVY